MLRRRGLAILALACLLSAPALAADPGAKPALNVGGAVNDVAIAWDTGAVAVVHQDPGSRTSVSAGPTADVWHLYSPSLQEIQSGHADIGGCESGALLDDCQTHATHVALSSDGTRMVVGSTPDSNNALLTFIRDTSGDDHRVQLAQGALRDLAMSENGQTIVAVTDLGTGTNNRGRVFLINWPAGTGAPTVGWTDELLTGPTDVAISPDGNSIAVAEGGRHHRYHRNSAGSQFTDNNFSGTGTDVAVASNAQHASIAGSSDGWFLLYEDSTGGDRRELRLRDGTSSLDAVAIRHDATALAVGNANGDAWVYRLDPVLFTVSQVGKVTPGGAVREIAFARDGHSFAVAHGDAITHYAIDGNAIVKLWGAALASSGGDVAIDEKGERVAGAAGSSAIVYDAVHRIDVARPTPPSAVPGQTHKVVVGYTNAGNRIETVNFALQAPAGWTAVPDRTSARLLPDQQVALTINVTVPAQEEPGGKDVRIVHTAGAAGTGTTTLSFNVPSIERWTLAPDGPASLGIQSGGSNSFIVNVTNSGNVVKVPPLSVSASPAGWTATLAGNDGTLAAGQTRQVVVQLTAPTGAAQLAQGTARVTLPGAAGSPLVLTGTIGASFGVELDGPASVEASGNATRVSLTVRNTGNAPDGARITVSLPSGWEAAYPSGDVASSIPAGQTGTIHVDLDVPAGEFTPTEVTFTATSVGDPTKADVHKVIVSPSMAETGTPTPTKDDGGKKGSPGLAPLAILGALGLAGIAFRARRPE